MIEGRCKVTDSKGIRTDAYPGAEWPTKFVAVPRVGEYVYAKSGSVSLEVKSITHLGIGFEKYFDGSTNAAPLILVELDQ